MKYTLLVLILLGGMNSNILSQPTVRQVSAEDGFSAGITSRHVNNGDDFPISPSRTDLKTFAIELSQPVSTTNKILVKVAGTSIVAGSSAEILNSDGTTKSFIFQDNVINKAISIVQVPISGTQEVPILKFSFIQTNAIVSVTPPVSTTNIIGGPQLPPLTTYMEELLTNYKLTQLGLVTLNTSGGTDPNSTHIFFDEFGNSLVGAIPQGVANRQYVVHLIYRGYAKKQRNVRYSIKQKTGTYSSALSINNTGAIKNLPDNLQGNEVSDFDKWQEEIFPLGIATDDITFDIIATTEGDDGKPVKIVLESQTIKMSPVYHASIDIGLINSTLSNPTFDLVDAPDGSANKVVRETDRAPTGIVTIMATFYASPIVIIEKLLDKKNKKNIPKYKLTGRSLFDDHTLFERIYPSVGVSISSKSFENLFFGLNWEIARGLSIFGGAHWGKVNTFEMPGFVPGETPVTQPEFDYYKNTKWKIDWAYGVKLDVSIVTNLFK